MAKKRKQSGDRAVNFTLSAPSNFLDEIDKIVELEGRPRSEILRDGFLLYCKYKQQLTTTVDINTDDNNNLAE